MAPACLQSVKKVVGGVVEYDTPKIVHIKSKFIGIINRVVQLVIIGYVLGYAIIWNKGYQKFDTVVSSITTKIKGVAMPEGLPSTVSDRVWDVADVIVPPQESKSFFVTTSFIATPQSPTTCDEDPSVYPSPECNSTVHCSKGSISLLGHGVQTGNCVDSTKLPGKKMCEIRGWCPTENDVTPPSPTLLDTANFTVLIKNHILFPLYNQRSSNIVTFKSATSLKKCQYNEDTDKYCPIFKLSDMVKLAGVDYYSIAKYGGVISIRIRWQCNLDYDIEECRPEYSFTRLDTDKDNAVSRGYNFRYSQNYARDSPNGTLLERRILYKAYGILFVVRVTGRGGAFNVVPFFTTLGSGMALLSISVVICDVLVLYFHKHRSYFWGSKYQHVSGQESSGTFEYTMGID